VCWLHLISVRSAVLQAATAPYLHLKPLDLLSRDLMFAFVRTQEDFLFWTPCTLCDFIDTTSSLLIDVTSSLLLRLHFDRGLVRHGYPWVPTDQGPRGPCQMDPTCQKPCRLQVGPEALSTIPATLEDLGRPYPDHRRPAELVEQASPYDHDGGAAIRPEDRGILSVITKDDLPQSVTDPDEGSPTSKGNPSPPAI
jgi:hypothetical protein